MSTTVEYVERTPVIEIATELRRGGEVVTPIWGVVVEGEPYIRSAYGESRWYRRLQRTGRATLVDGDERHPVAIENLDADAPVVSDVEHAYEEKYADAGESLQQVVDPDKRRFTMRLKPL
jgi:hypothetical protein